MVQQNRRKENKDRRSIDLEILHVQRAIVKATTAIGRVAEEADVAQIRKCTDAIAMLGHATRKLSLIRRKLLSPPIHPRLCDETVEVTENLFGDLAKSVERLEQIDKTCRKDIRRKAGQNKGNNSRMPRYANYDNNNGGSSGGNRRDRDKGSFLGPNSNKHFPKRRHGGNHSNQQGQRCQQREREREGETDRQTNRQRDREN